MSRLKLELHSDATAAIGICKRQGLGRVRHLATADLWVQQKVRGRELKLFKLPGKDNPSDLMTKHKTSPECSRFLTMLGIKPLDGRPKLAQVPVEIPTPRLLLLLSDVTACPAAATTQSVSLLS